MLCVAAAAGCVGPDPIFRFGGGQTDDAGATGTGGTSPTGTGGSPSTGTGGSPSTGTGGSPTTGRGGGGGTPTTGTGGTGGSSSTGTGGTGTGGSGSPGGAPGTVLLMDDFEGGIQSSKWIANVAGEWTTATDGTTVAKVAGMTNSLHAIAGGNVAWTNIAIEAKVKVLTTGGSSSSYFSGPCVRFANAANYYCAAVRSDGKFAIRARLNDSGTSLVTAPSSVTVTTNTWYTVKIAVIGPNITIFLNGTQAATFSDSTIAAGGVALAAVNETTEFDDVVVTAD